MDKKQMKDKYDIDSPGMADCLAMGEEIPNQKGDELQLPKVLGGWMGN